jgi:hypothetical protein
MRGEGEGGFRSSGVAFGHRVLNPTLNSAVFEKNLGEQICERKTNRRVAPMLHGLLGTKRKSLIFKGFKGHRTQHEICGKNEGELQETRYSQA